MTEPTSAFIGAPIEPEFDVPPELEKRPGAPDAFGWEGHRYRIVEVISEWHDYGPRGKSRTFYEKEQGTFRALAARRSGTWGVGRDYYRVEVEGGSIYELYYDRSPRGSHGRKGGWFLFRRLQSEGQ